MGHKHTKAEILAGALATASTHGLSQLSYGRVAKHLGIPDRTVVYYFPTKNDLITEVVMSMGLELQATLAGAYTKPVDNHRDLVGAAWPLLATAEVDPVFALFFEANGLATAGRAPYDTLLPQLVEAWITWTMEFLEGSAERRRSEAETTIVIVDGLLLMRQMVGPEAADRVAAVLTG